MSLIQGSEIVSLIELFDRRGVEIYHACQYRDFKTYLELGGVPSRNLMESSGLPYTPFDTDKIDKTNEVWTKVFGNLSDFGSAFAKGRSNPNTAPTPNPYGPILLRLAPSVLNEADDIAICLRSAGGRNFNREAESLASANEVDRIFKYSIEDAPYDTAKAFVKFRPDLVKEFGYSQAAAPEVSCTVENEILSFNHLSKVLVDPYVINGQSLTDKVRSLKQRHRLNCVIWERQYIEDRLEIKQELANLLLQEFVTANEIVDNQLASEPLRDWATRIIRGNIAWEYERFARYLRMGTILELSGESS